MSELDLLDVALLAAAGLGAGVVNTLAGGGSLLTLPALMLVGLDAATANATNRVAITSQCASSTTAFTRAGLLPGRALWGLAAPLLAGGALGAWLASVVPSKVLEPVLLVLLVGMALLLALRPGALDPPEGAEVRAAGPKELAALFVAGFWGGFIQAGVGFVLLAVLAGALRWDLVRANALKVSLVLALSSAALAIFAWHGLVSWIPGLVLAAGTISGALIGVRLAVRHPRRLRWIVLVCVIAAACAIVGRR